MLIIAELQCLKCLNIRDTLESCTEVLNHMCAQRLDVLDFDELKHLQNGRVQKIIPAIIGNESVNDWTKQVPFDDIAVVELIFQGNDFPHKSHGTKLEESVP